MQTISRDNLPCIFYASWYEDVAGDGGSRMFMSDCNYEGNIDISECKCGNTCCAYKAPEIKVCEKHQQEYYDICPKCEDESWGFGGMDIKHER